MIEFDIPTTEEVLAFNWAPLCAFSYSGDVDSTRPDWRKLVYDSPLWRMLCATIIAHGAEQPSRHPPKITYETYDMHGGILRLFYDGWWDGNMASVKLNGEIVLWIAVLKNSPQYPPWFKIIGGFVPGPWVHKIVDLYLEIEVQ